MTGGEVELADIFVNGRKHAKIGAEDEMDWTGCPAVERIPGKVSEQWIVKGTRILADGVLENADAGYTPQQLATEIYEGLPVESARAILAFAKRKRTRQPAA